MNLILLFDDDFAAPDRVRLGGRRLRHIVEVHRAGPGDVLRVGRVGGRIGRGRIVALSSEEVEMEVHLDAEPPSKLPLRLLLALPRPKALRRVLQTVATMGVSELVLLKSWRVEKSYWSTPLLEDGHLREQLILGLEQGCDTMIPTVTLEKRFKPFVEDRLPAMVQGDTALVAHPTATAPCPRAVGGPVTLAIGPEGGFIPYEIAALEQIGFRAVTLGERILRVEQAIPALIGRLV